MASEVDIEVIEDNDPVVTFICRVDGAVVDLTGALIEMFLKADKSTAEDAVGVVEYSTAGGQITIPSQVGALKGYCYVQMSANDLGTPGKLRYRVDVTQNGRKLTYAYGRVIIVDV
jgi:hypothetical protein